MSDFEVTMSEHSVRVRHRTEGHSYVFQRIGKDTLSDTVMVTPNHESRVFASSLEADARAAALQAVKRSSGEQ